MPSKSKKQARLMAAVAHSPKFAKKVGIPQSVGREFNDADRVLRKYAEGGKVGKAAAAIRGLRQALGTADKAEAKERLRWLRQRLKANNTTLDRMRAPHGNYGFEMTTTDGRGNDVPDLDVDRDGWEQHVDENIKMHKADGGRVLPSSTEDEESWSDTYLKRPLAGLASMWGGVDPETGEFVSPAVHNLKRAWNQDERRRQGLPPQKKAKLGIIESAKALPGLAYAAGSLFDESIGEATPQWVRDAEESESQIFQGARDAVGVDAPHGFTENLMEAAGVMGGQLPIAGQASKLKKLKNKNLLKKIGSSAAEWLSPIVDPKLGNYAAGTAFGGILGGAADHLGDYVDNKERAAQHKEWIAEAMAEVLAEEAQAAGNEDTDEEALVALGYAEGGRVSGARKAISSLRSILQQTDPDDVNARKAKIDAALNSIKGTEGIPLERRASLQTSVGGLSDAAADTLPERRRQRYGDYESNVLRLLEDVAPQLVERRTPTRMPTIRPTNPPPIIPKITSGHGFMSAEQFDAEVLKKKSGMAEGGEVKHQGYTPAPQSQKVPNAQALLIDDPRGATPLSQAWYENYGAGPEHLFMGDRTVKLHDMWGPKHYGAVPQTPQQSQGSWLPAAGILGFAAYDEWKKRRGEGEDTSQAAFWQQQHDSAANTSDTDAWVKQQLEQYGSSAPMPIVNSDGSTSYVQPNKFWANMHNSALNTSDTDAWVNQQLDTYANEMAMPRVNDDGSVSYVNREGNPVNPGQGGLGRAWQGIGGAYDAFSGLQQGGVGGYAQAASGINDLYGAYTGADTGLLGQGAGTLGGLASIYGGLQEGGVRGYTQAASGAAQTAQSLGYNPAGMAGNLGTAASVVGALYSAYGAYESAKVGDKKGAVAQGAAAGAAVGSVVPVVGTAVGAVVGAVAGLVGASLGDKQQASEAYYGAHKKLDQGDVIRGWSEDQVGGAVYETIKSHTKSGNINKFPDVSEMYTAFGITKDAHKNYKNVQAQMGDFIKGVVEVAQQTGALPSDPAALKELDGQQIYYKVVVPAMAAKYKEATGKDSTAWTVDKINPEGGGQMQNLFADWTDWMTSHWGDEAAAKANEVAAPETYAHDWMGGNWAQGGRVSPFNHDPRAGALSAAYQ